MIGLIGVGLGLYVVYALGKDVKYTKKDLTVKQGIGAFTEQKRNIDQHFIDIVEYSGAKCKVKNHRVVDATPNQYGGMEIYLMKKVYSQEAIDYCKQKFDDIADKSQKKIVKKRDNQIYDFENALETHSIRDMAIISRKWIYNTTKFDKVIRERIDYLHKHNNPQARTNDIVGGSTPRYDFDVTYIIKVP